MYLTRNNPGTMLPLRTLILHASSATSRPVDGDDDGDMAGDGEEVTTDDGNVWQPCAESDTSLSAVSDIRLRVVGVSLSNRMSLVSLSQWCRSSPP